MNYSSGKIAVVDGVRTPFIKAWTLFDRLPAQTLGALCVRELLERTEIDPKKVDEVIIGCVGQPVDAANVARIISLYAGIPKDKKATGQGEPLTRKEAKRGASATEIVCGLIITSWAVTLGAEKKVISGHNQGQKKLCLFAIKKIAAITAVVNAAPATFRPMMSPR